MFTGIIEALGAVTDLQQDHSNVHITVASPFSEHLKMGQSLAHNGVCLTIVGLSSGQHTVTATETTLKHTNLSGIRIHDLVNLERSLPVDGRFDGHIVQGHIDQTGICTSRCTLSGSWIYTFNYNASSNGPYTVEKGSICVNGISLTVLNSGTNTFSVTVIPHTYAHTNLQQVREGSVVNLEFDIIGKYVARHLFAPCTQHAS